MKTLTTRRYNAFLVRPAPQGARRGEGFTIVHIQSGSVTLAASPRAAVGWMQRQSMPCQPVPGLASQDGYRR